MIFGHRTIILLAKDYLFCISVRARWLCGLSCSLCLGETALKTYIFALVLLFVCGIGVFAQSGWTVQPSNIAGDLIAVFFTSSDRGWIAGDEGFLASTTDGGKNWIKYPLGTTENINEIYFRNDDNGYLVAGRKMFITRDAGRTWQDIRIYQTGEFGAGRPEFLSIRFSDKKKGYVIGSVLRKSVGRRSGCRFVADADRRWRRNVAADHGSDQD